MCTKTSPGDSDLHSSLRNTDLDYQKQHTVNLMQPDKLQEWLTIRFKWPLIYFTDLERDQHTATVILQLPIYLLSRVNAYSDIVVTKCAIYPYYFHLQKPLGGLIADLKILHIHSFVNSDMPLQVFSMGPFSHFEYAYKSKRNIFKLLFTYLRVRGK